MSARLGDALSCLYIASAALKRFADQGRQPEDRPLLAWAVRDALYRTQQAVFEVYDNFPIRWLGRVLRWALFPYGAVYRPPGDTLVTQAADVILHAGDARERLTEGLYLPDEPSESLTQLEVAMQAAATAQPVLLRLRNAMRSGQLASGDPEQCLMQAIAAGVIDEPEAALVNAAVTARRRVIEVDEFPAGYWAEEGDSCQHRAVHSPRAARST